MFASTTMQRGLKALMVAGVSLYFAVIALGNVTDYDVNYQFVKHVFSMDTTSSDSAVSWRAIHSPLLWQIGYLGIIAWEILTALLTGLGAWRLAACAGSADGAAVTASRRFASNAIVLGLLLWMVAFGTIGAEWFQMWRSKEWNGLEGSFRNLMTQGLVLLYLNQPE